MRVGSVNVLEAMTWTDTRAEVLRGKMILTHAFDDPIHGYSFTCFPGTKSTNTDADGACRLVLSRYRELLASSTFTFCPEGVHVESYRVWEV